MGITVLMIFYTQQRAGNTKHSQEAKFMNICTASWDVEDAIKVLTIIIKDACNCQRNPH